VSVILGPIVGHTDDRSSRIWIRVDDDPREYAVRVPGVGVFPFVSTEDSIEFGTAVAVADGLRPDFPHLYHVLRRDRLVPQSHGSFRTMPRLLDRRGMSFATLSCNSNTELGSWPQLRDYVFTGVPPVPGQSLRPERPRFLLMVGDQVYVDQKIPRKKLGDNAWETFFLSSSQERRAAIARWYQENWGRRTLRDVMANIPIYMMWDDHEIRNGWGSLAHDSPSIAARYPDYAHLQLAYNAIFEDFRTVYWHFQRSHGPIPGVAPQPGERRAMPAVFRVSRVLVLMIDSRGDRDVFRDKADKPALGRAQWAFINNVFETVPADIDHLVVTTAAPIAHYSKNAIAQRGLPAKTTYDVKAFRKGLYIGGDGQVWFPGEGLLPRNLWHPFRAVQKVVTDVRGVVTDIRDQWPHHSVRAEQEELIRAASRAQFANRPGGAPRDLVFVAGDVHFGGDYRLKVRNPTEGRAISTCRCFFSSGIGKRISDDNLELVKGGSSVKHRFRTKRGFQVAKGIRSKLKSTEWRMNFGIIQTTGPGDRSMRTSLQSTQPFSSRRSVARKQKRN
jgi:hypothetical protein